MASKNTAGGDDDYTAARPIDVNEEVALAVTMRSRWHAAAEALCMDRANDYPQNHHGHYAVRALFSANELAIFDSLSWGNEAIAKELGRCRAVLELQRVAGTSNERADAEQGLAEATQALEEKGPRLQAEIEERQRALAALQGDVRRFKGEVDRRADAVAKLRDRLPAHVDEEVRRIKQRVKTAWHEEMTAVEAAVRAGEDPSAAAQLKQLQEQRARDVADAIRPLIDRYCR